MGDDELTNLTRYDELVIIVGNKMCEKYRKQHHFQMIRSRLRTIARFLSEIKKVNSKIQRFADVFKPVNYDDVIKSINIVAGLNYEECRYKAPSTAFALGTLLKKSSKSLKSECIKRGDIEAKNQVIDFLHLIE